MVGLEHFSWKRVFGMVKVFLVSVGVFLLCIRAETYWFYDHLNIGYSDFSKIFFAPILLLIDLVNLVIPISDTEFFQRIVVNRRYPRLPLDSIGSLISLLAFFQIFVSVYFFRITDRFQNVPKSIRIVGYIVFVALCILACWLISGVIFGSWWFRFCGNCA